MTTEQPLAVALCLYCGERPQHSRGRCTTCPCCGRRVFALGLCQMRYMRQYRHGDPDVVLPKTNRKANHHA